MTADVLRAAAVPRAGRTRVIAIEGRSGAGKSTLARAVAAALHAPIVKMDEVIDGWDGLRTGITAVEHDLLAPLRAGTPAGWRRYDWQAGAYAEWHPVHPPEALVLDGVGSGARALAPYLSALVWVEAPDDVRRTRAFTRDGEVYRPHWDRWAAHENHYYATDDVRGRADVVVRSKDTR